MWKVGGKIVDGDVTHIVGIQLQVSLLRNSIYWWSRGFSKRDYFDHIQRRIQGKGPGGLGSPLFLDQTEVRRARKKYFLRPPPPTKTFPPPLLFQDLDDRVHPLSESLDPPVIYVRELRREIAAVTQLARKSEFSSCQVLLLQFQLSRFVKDESWTNS